MKCPDCSTPILAIDAEVDPRAVSLLLRAQCGHVIPAPLARNLWDSGMRWALPVVDGAALLAAERSRQVHEEGYTPALDAERDPNELTWAAWCLLDAAASETPVTEPPKMWPWDDERWKPEHSPLRRLVIAGALIAAEIDRRLMAERGKHGTG
jgi:hypothetical protein